MENRTLHDHDWVNDKDWVIRINSYHINDKDWLNPKYCFTYFKYAACKYFFCVELNKKSPIFLFLTFHEVFLVTLQQQGIKKRLEKEYSNSKDFCKVVKFFFAIFFRKSQRISKAGSPSKFRKVNPIGKQNCVGNKIVRVLKPLHEGITSRMVLWTHKFFAYSWYPRYLSYFWRLFPLTGCV